MATKWEDLFTSGVHEISEHPHYTMGAGAIFFIIILACCLCLVCSSLAYAFIEKKKVCGYKLLGGQYGCPPSNKKCYAVAKDGTSATVIPADTFANVEQYEEFEGDDESYDDESYDDEYDQ